MSNTLFNILCIFVCLCFSASIKPVAATSSEEEFVVTEIDKVNSIEENVQQYKKIFYYLNGKFKGVEQKLNNFESTIDEKLKILEKNIVGSLQNYMESKLNTIENKISQKIEEKLSETFKIYKDSYFDQKFSELMIVAVENERKFEASQNKTDEYLNTAIFDTAHALNDTMLHTFFQLYNLTNVSAQRLERFANETSLNIFPKLLNTTSNCSNREDQANNETIGDSLINTTSDTSQELRETSWDECNVTVVKDTVSYTEFSKPLQSLADKTLRHVSFHSAGGRTHYVNMRLGLQADFNVDIILSPDPEGSRSNFRIRTHPKYVDFRQKVDGDIKWSKYEREETIINLSDKQPTTLQLTIANGMLQLRNDNSSLPFVEHYDDLLNEIKYFGFDACCNDLHYAKIYYNC